jgi:t-SNARE complex subunit (syntaxin)
MWFLRKRQSKSTKEAADALQEAHENLREVQKRNPEVLRVSRSLRELRERNHFAENLEAIIIRHGGPL